MFSPLSFLCSTISSFKRLSSPFQVKSWASKNSWQFHIPLNFYIQKSPFSATPISPTYGGFPSHRDTPIPPAGCFISIW